jgi:hypothetical protein
MRKSRLFLGVAALSLLGCAGDDGGASATESASTTGDTGTTAASTSPSTTGASTTVPTGGETETGASGSATDTGDTPGCVVHVDGRSGDDDHAGGSWLFAKRTVNAGLAEAEAEALAGRGPCAVWVAAGTYTPSDALDVDASFTLREDIALYGGFAGDEAALDERDWVANSTILSGEYGDPGDLEDNARHVVLGADGARVDGFTITGGHARGDASQRNGAGVVSLGGALTIANCRITGNVTGPGGDGEVNTVGGSGGLGAGVYVSGGSLTLVDSTVSGNVGGPGGFGSAVGGVGGEGPGVAFVGGAALLVSGVTFEGNIGGQGGEGGDVGGPGGGGVGLLVIAATGEVRIERSSFKGNVAGAGGPSGNLGGPGNGGALTITAGDGDVIVDRCVIEGNEAGAGGPSGNLPGPRGGFAGMLYAGNTVGAGGIVIVNSRFVGNNSDFGAGLGLIADPANPAGPVVLVNSMIAGNTANTASGLYLRHNGARALTVANTTIAGNTAMSRNAGLWYQSQESAGAAPARIVNTILWGNDAPQDPEIVLSAFNVMVPIPLEIAASVVAGGCPADPLIACSGVLTGDPLFVDEGGLDLHLGPASPAADAGDDAALPADAADLDDDGDLGEATPLDLDESPRIVGGAVDLGAFERP